MSSRLRPIRADQVFDDLLQTNRSRRRYDCPSRTTGGRFSPRGTSRAASIDEELDAKPDRRLRVRRRLWVRRAFARVSRALEPPGEDSEPNSDSPETRFLSAAKKALSPSTQAVASDEND